MTQEKLTKQAEEKYIIKYATRLGSRIYNHKEVLQSKYDVYDLLCSLDYYHYIRSGNKIIDAEGNISYPIIATVNDVEVVIGSTNFLIPNERGRDYFIQEGNLYLCIKDLKNEEWLSSCSFTKGKKYHSYAYGRLLDDNESPISVEYPGHVHSQKVLDYFKLIED